MKISNKQLKQIIKEELAAVLGEGGVAYSGVVLDEQSVQALTDAAKKFGIPEGFVFNTKAGAPLPHHMTIVPFSPIVHPKGKHDLSADYPVGGEITLEVLSFGYTDKAMAALVKPPAPIHKKVKFPHVTIAIPEGGRPFDSNKIPKENFKGPKPTVKDEQSGEEKPLFIKGIVQEVPS